MSLNLFYREFDTECLERARRQDMRTPFQKDRDRIIYTSAFRRLQAKTQVFMSGEYDFYRTRLTHSLEVAQIGRSLCYYLQQSSDDLNIECYIDSDLVEAICLAHDLGHPPFGHAGEKTLNSLMRSYGGFEGNAQTLRILTETIYSDQAGRKGMNPTRAFMDGILKYKALFSDFEHPDNHFLYDDQESLRDFVFGSKPVPEDLTTTEALNTFRSVECQIMDWADDTAYSINDIVDGISAGFLHSDLIQRWAATKSLNAHQSHIVEQLLVSISEQRANRYFASRIGEFIRAVRLTPWSNFLSELSQRYCYRLFIEPDIQDEARLYKKLSVDLVFHSPQIYQLEFKEDNILRQLFKAYEEQYIKNTKPAMKLLPAQYEFLVTNEPDPVIRARIICDHLASMTDGFAIRTYKRLYDPDFGSIVDLV
ncbi:dNTP triphosphohydrolase [candidate division KSB1 bacterium]|nr:dNTP triphosphohydrolase [candidate division KSB1 bacterium]